MSTREDQLLFQLDMQNDLVAELQREIELLKLEISELQEAYDFITSDAADKIPYWKERAEKAEAELLQVKDDYFKLHESYFKRGSDLSDYQEYLNKEKQESKKWCDKFNALDIENYQLKLRLKNYE